MSAPGYDWLKDLTVAQRKFLNDNYKSFWHEYQSYGFSLVSYQYASQIDKIYEETMSVRIVESVPLPLGLKESIQEFNEVRMRAHNLKYIVTPVEDYHITVITDDTRVVSEVKQSLRDIYVKEYSTLDEDLSKYENTAIILDDVSMIYKSEWVKLLELNCVPFIRRTTLGWTSPAITNLACNVLLKFVGRYRPCKLLR